MTDIVERLRKEYDNPKQRWMTGPDLFLFGEAADEIERLRASLAAECEVNMNHQAEIARHMLEIQNMRAERDALREDAERWRTLPMFIEDYQINYVRLKEEIDAARREA